MSGIVGGVGSKSGVIGNTELIHEEGTYTPVATGSGADPTNAGESGSIAGYERIGNTVHVGGAFITNWSDGSGSLRMSLPFTAASLSSENYVTGSLMAHNFNWDGDTANMLGWTLRTNPSQAYVTFYGTGDSTAQLVQTVEPNQDGVIRFQLTYSTYTGA